MRRLRRSQIKLLQKIVKVLNFHLRSKSWFWKHSLTYIFSFEVLLVMNGVLRRPHCQIILLGPNFFFTNFWFFSRRVAFLYIKLMIWNYMEVYGSLWKHRIFSLFQPLVTFLCSVYVLIKLKIWSFWYFFFLNV